MNHSSRLRHVGYLALSLAALVLAAPAHAAPVASKAPVTTKAQANKPAQKPAATQTRAATGTQALHVATSGDWGIFTAGTAKSKVCYALSRPKDRQPTSLKRDPGYIFVSFRPAEKVSGELAIVVGFPTKEDVGGELIIGANKFVMLSKGANVWLKAADDEPAVLAAMQKNATKPMTVAVQSARGNKSTDRYSLTGFAGALARAKQECR